MKTIPTLVTMITALTAGAVLANEPDVNVTVRDARAAAERAMQEAREAADIMQQHFAQAGVAGARNVRLTSRAANQKVRTLVASVKAADPKEIAKIEEDLSVMHRLLNKEVEKAGGGDPMRAMGIAISSWGGDAKGAEAIYLDGFGALFTLNVSFPLVPPAEEKAEKKPAAAADSEWEKARAEVFGQPEPDDPLVGGVVIGGPRMAVQEYDPDKVDELKRTILTALRNAVNIRCLKPEDSVNVAVLSNPNPFGAGNVFTSHMTVTVVQQDGKTVTKSSGGGPEGGKTSTLNVRVKKADLDRFSEGKLTLDELKQKAAITVY